MHPTLAQADSILHCPFHSTHFKNKLQFSCNQNNILVLQMAMQGHFLNGNITGVPLLKIPPKWTLSLLLFFNVSPHFILVLVFFFPRGEFSSILYSVYIVFKINNCKLQTNILRLKKAGRKQPSSQAFNCRRWYASTAPLNQHLCYCALRLLPIARSLWWIMILNNAISK